jgi:hypothetical protein
MEKLLIGNAEERIVEYIESVSRMDLSIIDREIAEEIQDLDFIIAQLRAEPKSYSSDRTREIAHDLLVRKVKIALLKGERDRRTRSHESA